MMQVPPLIALPATPPDTVGRLRRSLQAAATDPEAVAILEVLWLAGFARVDSADYDRFLAQALEAATVGYAVPG